MPMLPTPNDVAAGAATERRPQADGGGGTRRGLA